MTSCSITRGLVELLDAALDIQHLLAYCLSVLQETVSVDSKAKKDVTDVQCAQRCSLLTCSTRASASSAPAMRVQ